MPPVRSRNKFSSEFFIPFLKWNTSVLSCCEHICSIYLRSQLVEKGIDGPFCFTKACLKPFHALKPCHWAEKKLACSEGRLRTISPEPAEWFARKQGHVSGFWSGPLKEVLHVYTGGRWDLPLLFYRTECCLLLLNSNIDAAFLRNRMRLSCFLRRWEGIHTNILMNVVWDSGGSHSFLTWSSVSIFPEKVPSGKKVRIHHRLRLSHTQVPKEHSKYRNTQPRALQMRLRWASLFCLPFFCWPFWGFQKWIPNPMAVSVVAAIANLLRRVPGIFQASDNHVGNGCS